MIKEKPDSQEVGHNYNAIIELALFEAVQKQMDARQAEQRGYLFRRN